MSDRVLLIEWDAADWKVLHPLIDDGKLPALGRIVDEGISGQLSGTQPFIAANSCASILTGKRGWQHGICHSLEFSPATQKAVPISAASRKAATLWEMLSREGKRSVAVGWPASQHDRTANCDIVSDRYPEPTAPPGVSPWPPAAAGTYWPEELRAFLDAKRASPEHIGPEVISRHIPSWQNVDRKRDPRVGHLRVFLAADYSIQNAALELLRSKPWDFAAIRFPALGLISRMFVRYSVAAQNGANDPETETYKSVVPFACHMLDHMLGQLISCAGPGAAVIIASGHGVRTQSIPAAGFPASDDQIWKSPFGIFAASGPALARDALIHGARVLDIAPTILCLFGLPIGDDMEGRVLVEGFVETPKIGHIPTWQSAKAEPIAAPKTASENSAASTIQFQSDWNLARSGLDAGRFAEMLPVLTGLFRQFPERAEIADALFQCQIALRKPDDAQQTLEVLLEAIPAGAPNLLARAELALARRDFNAARALASELKRHKFSNPAMLRKFGFLLLRLREWNALVEVAHRALAADQNDSTAWLGLAVGQLRAGRAAEAEEAAKRAFQLNFFLPDAHFIYARALLTQGRWSEARQAMQTLLAIQPDNRTATSYFRRMENNSP